jgi:endonuclease G
MRKVTSILVLFLLAVKLFSLEFGDFLPKCDEHLLLTRPGYVNCYDEDLRASHWVYWLLTADMVNSNTTDRGGFIQDKETKAPRIVTGDYTNSGYDRGHLVLADDMDDDPARVTAAGLMTNVLPQFPKFNRYGTWRKSETYGQALAKYYGSVVIIAGPLFRSTIDYVSAKRIPVPSHYFKIFWFDTGVEAYVFPHEDSSESDITPYRVEAQSLYEELGLPYPIR